VLSTPLNQEIASTDLNSLCPRISLVLFSRDESEAAIPRKDIAWQGSFSSFRSRRRAARLVRRVVNPCVFGPADLEIWITIRSV
jgi:hypothetical protein